MCPPETKRQNLEPDLLQKLQSFGHVKWWLDMIYVAAILASRRGQSYYDVKCNGRKVFNIQITRMLRLQLGFRGHSPGRTGVHG